MALFSPIEGRDRDPVAPEVYLRDGDRVADEATTPAATPDLEDWELLGRTEQWFVQRVLVYAELAKGAIAESITTALARRRTDLSDEYAEILESSARRHYRHSRLLAEITGRFGPDADERLRDEATEVIRSLFDSLWPDSLAEPERHWVAALVTYDLVLVDVLVDTGYYAIAQLLERNGVLPEVLEVARRLHSEDEEARSRRLALLDRLRESGETTRELVETGLDEAVLPCIRILRNFQDQFDFIRLGLVPNEFVARALERFFELSDSPSADLRSMAP